MPIVVPPPVVGVDPFPGLTGPDLSSAELRFEALMDDECVVTRDEAGNEDATLGPDGELIDPAPVQVYLGKCLVSGSPSPELAQGGVVRAVSTEYELKLPLSWLRAHLDQEPARGDEVQITASRRDPALVGRLFTVEDVPARTITVTRTCKLKLRN